MDKIVAQNDELGQRVCNLFEFLQGEPDFESYKNLCKKVGDEAIEYKEFDFWFHRFANGKLDLDYDKSLEPETRSFSEIPIDIVGSIVDYLNPVDRFIVRKVNRNFRKLVDNHNQYKKVEFLLDKDSVQIKFSTESIEYIQEIDGCMIKCGGNEKRIEGGDYMEIALNDLASVLKIPELRLDLLKISRKTRNIDREIFEKCYEFMGTFLKSLNHQLSVDDLRIRAVKWEDVMTILPYLKAGTLTKIFFALARFNSNENEAIMNRIFETEQWKHAKQVATNFFEIPSLLIDNIQHVTHFSFHSQSITADHVRQILNAMFNYASLQKCDLYSSSPINLAEIEKALDPHVPNDSGIRRYPIPNTNRFLKIEFRGKQIAFRKCR